MADMNKANLDKLSFIDYLGAKNFLRAYADDLKATNVLRSSEERENAELTWQVADGLARKLEEIFDAHSTNAKFNKIVNNESWDGS